MSETHANVEFLSVQYICTYVSPYVTASSAGHSYHVTLLPPCVSIVLSHSVSFIEHVCPTVMLTEKEAKDGH